MHSEPQKPNRDLVEHFTLHLVHTDPIARDEFAQVAQKMLCMLHVSDSGGINLAMHLSKFTCSRGRTRYIIDFQSL